MVKDKRTNCRAVVEDAALDLDSRTIHGLTRRDGRLRLLFCTKAVERVATAHLGVEGAEWKQRAEDGRLAAARERALQCAAKKTTLYLEQGGIAPTRWAAAAPRQRCMADGAAHLALAAAAHAVFHAA